MFLIRAPCRYRTLYCDISRYLSHIEGSDFDERCVHVLKSPDRVLMLGFSEAWSESREEWLSDNECNQLMPVC